MYYARSDRTNCKVDWQPLIEHLNNVAELSASFAAGFASEELAFCIGLLHDAGKYSAAFQRRLNGGPKVDHSTAGAQIAIQKYRGIGWIMAYCICGHHGGLPDGVESGLGERCTSLSSRLKRQTEDYCSFFDEVSLPAQLTAFLKLGTTAHQGFSLSFYTRMLFSALTDADCMNAEQWTSPALAKARAEWPTLSELTGRFFANREQLQKATKTSMFEGSHRTDIMWQRAAVYQNCLDAAELPPGLFTLTVPTGGGKTLSSMAFALRHAQRHGKNRVVYAIPFTSIIEQNASVFRNVLGADAVLEHHSNYVFQADKDKKFTQEEERELTERLAADNYDAPIIITTNVQLFESLFSNKPSKCRKLHNLANSVIILDEAQALPDEYLKPCLEVLECLCRDFGATVVFCTATQPALDGLLENGLRPQEIITDPDALFAQMKRVQVVKLGVLSDEALAERLLSHDQALCIVNTRKHAHRLYEKLDKSDSLFHLSALMCPAHRTVVLDAIRERLNAGIPCRVISTQLIEAGVDVDFPVVYRAAAGIDSIAQAAGRCNRERKQPMGNTFVFTPEDGLPKGQFAHMAQLGAEILAEDIDPLGMDAVKRFFKMRYRDAGEGGLDRYGIIRAFDEGFIEMKFPFEEVAREFSMIESGGMPVVIPYNSACIEALKNAQDDETAWRYARLLQRYTVNVYPSEYEELLYRGLLRTVGGLYAVLDADDERFEQVYRKDLGLDIHYEMG